ncbi:MAG TPA: hypothetical protein DD490_16400 [Acidobacteria bacterium]|nr:hypothetical protein [Acidobacteriota bacterium]
MSAGVVFLSYSHDSDAHREKVLGLAERLRQDGLNAQVDQYVDGTPEQGWPRWMLDRFDEAEWVLVICTATYYRRFRGHEEPGRGKGVDWEGALITQGIYDARSRTVKFVPVLLAADDEPFIPEPLRAHTHYELTSEEGYQDLYRFLLEQAGVDPAPLGEIKPPAPRTGRPLRFPFPRRLLWLAPTLVFLPLVVLSTFWHLPTRVQVELATARLAFTLGGAENREVLARSVPFSSLVIEECSRAVFTAEELEMADPRQLVPGTGADEPATYPPGAWQELAPTGPVTLSCRDPDAKLALHPSDPAASELGTLDRIYSAAGSQVILEVSPGREPSLSLEIETPQALSLTLRPDLEIVTDLVEAEGVRVPFSGGPLTWRARLPASRPTFELRSGATGLVLILTPARGQAGGIFRDPLDLPLASVELLAEDLEGALTSPLRDQASLTYPGYPAAPAVTIEKEEAVGLAGLSQARLTRLALDPEKGAMDVRFDGIVERAASKSGDFVADHRLTVADTFLYSRRWKLIALAAAWLVSTTWAAFEARRQLRG